MKKLTMMLVLLLMFLWGHDSHASVLFDDVLKAIEENDTTVITQYLESYGDIDVLDYKGRSLLQRAAARGHDEIVADLIQYKADVNHEDDEGNTALYAATLKNHELCVNHLLSAGANLNQTDKRGANVLHTACYKGYVALARLFMDDVSLKDIDQKTIKGQTALWLACLGWRKAFIVNDDTKAMMYETIVMDLINKGADPNVCDEDGTTLLHWSVYEGHKDQVELLLAAEADPNYQRNDGTTALMVSCHLGFEDIACRLINANTDVCLRAHAQMGGGTAFDYATQSGLTDIADALREKMLNDTAQKKENELAFVLQQMQQYAEQINFLNKKVLHMEDKGADYHHMIETLKSQFHKLSVAPSHPMPDLNNELTLLKKKIDLYDSTTFLQSSQIQDLQQQHHELWHNYSIEKRIEDEKKQLRRQPHTRIFYDTIFGKLQGLFHSYQMLDVGMVQRGTSNRWDKTSQGFSILGSVISLPFVGLVSSLLSSGAAHMADQHANKHVDFIVKRVRNPEITSKEVEESARLLTCTYHDQLLQLTDKGSQKLAECAIGRFIDYMNEERIEADIPLPLQMLTSTSTHASKQGFLGFRQQTIETKVKKKPEWTVTYFSAKWDRNTVRRSFSII